jgi:NAD(P)H dehydrogenase (quinone)
MSKVLVLYYSSYGHVERMAEAVAEGARQAPGVEVAIKWVPELVPEEIARQPGMKLNQAAPIEHVEELANYDAILFGTPTRCATWPHRCGTFSTRRTACGGKEH